MDLCELEASLVYKVSSRTARGQGYTEKPCLKKQKQKTNKQTKKPNEYMKFLGKWMYLEDIILSEATQSQKNTHDMHSLISGY